MKPMPTLTSSDSDTSQQFVDTPLGQSLGVPFLYDHCAIQAIAAVPGRQAAADYDRACGYATVADLSGFPVEYPGALTDEHPHRDHHVVLQDHPFHDFRTRADETVVADDGRIGLHRLQHAADAYSGKQLEFNPDKYLREFNYGRISKLEIIDIRPDV